MDMMRMDAGHSTAEHGRAISTKGITTVAVLLLAAIMLTAFALSSHAVESLTEQIQMRMLDVAKSAAATLDGDQLARLTREDKYTEPYQRVTASLRAFENSVDLRYIYCMRKKETGDFEFTVDPTVNDPAVYGELVKRTDALVQASAGTPSVDLEPYEDRWGRFYSAYCPVFDSQGAVVSIVGVDFSAELFEERVRAIHNYAILTCLVATGIVGLVTLGASLLTRSQRQHSASLQRAIEYDDLTGIAKMGRFFALAEQAHGEMLRQGQEPVMLYVDLVGMRFYNHRNGFEEGDKLLVAFARLLVRHFGEDRCGRMGQDEFAVMTFGDDIEGRLERLFDDAKRLRDGASLPVRVGICRDHMGDIAASTACDRAKAANRVNRTASSSIYAFFTDDLLEQIRRRQYVTSNIDRAIEEGWIQVYYQPIVRAANGRVCDEESLARWVDPKRGMLSPAEFIPALEDTRLAYKLDLSVLEQTLAKMRHLKSVGLYVVPCSINLSRSDFEICDMVEEVRKRVDASGIAREMINVEITETAMGRDFDFMKQQVERFHQHGFRVWMDDFGSEYSSLDYLQNLNFDLIKFDMRFMKQFDNVKRSRVILTELMKMAIGLGIDTITEGVETAEQVDFLREIGCDKLQGYYFTRPLPLEQVLRRYEDGTAIGFENPAESAYFAALGRISLYDLSSIARDDDESLRHYFDTLPMALAEADDEGFALVRSNESYREFMTRSFGEAPLGQSQTFDEARTLGGDRFLLALRSCGVTAERLIVNERMPDGCTINALVQHVATNPVTKRRALAIVVLAVTKGEG